MIPISIIAVLVLGLAYMGLSRGTTIRLANERTPKTIDWKALHAKAIGIPDDKAKDMSDDDQLAAHKAHCAAVEKLANDDDNDDDETEGEPAEMAEEVANEKVKTSELALANERKAREDAAKALANERKERAAELIGVALEAGRIVAADKAKWEGDFAADFDKAKAALANVKDKAIKTTAVTANAGERKQIIADEQERAEEVQQLVNEKMEKNKSLSYDAAFNAVRREKPALFEAMKQPEPKK